ncbi:MAG: DUF1800 domain-containing protein [Actinomycetota bacterium]
MARVGSREKVAHVVRRLSMGVHPDRLDALADTDAAIAAALDLAAAPAPPLEMAVPTDYGNPQPGEIATAIGWWAGQMTISPRLVEERLVWFWHDHFATSIVKVRVPYLMYQQHLTIRQHATGNFADLLRAISRDPAMLFYLDGITNQARQVNENFGRECMELFTLGIGGYTQEDVVEASRAFSGWVVNVPGRRFTRDDVPLWSAYFAPQRHDAGEKTLLGTTGALDMDGALDVILAEPATGRFVASKLYRELVGVEPDDKTAARLGDAFARDYAILPLVEAIVAEAAFTGDAAVRTKARTPVEKLIGLIQSVPGATLAAGQGGNGRGRNPQQSPLGRALRTMGYIPFVPPNVGGFPSGESLLGPHQLVHTFDLLGAIDALPTTVPDDVDGLFARFGLFDVSARSRDVVAGEPDPGRRLALVFTSPEYAAI